MAFTAEEMIGAAATEAGGGLEAVVGFAVDAVVDGVFPKSALLFADNDISAFHLPCANETGNQIMVEQSPCRA